jgi:hypothetical protein
MAWLRSYLTLSKLCLHNLTRINSHPPQVNERRQEAAVNVATRTSSASALRTTLAPHLTFELRLQSRPFSLSLTRLARPSEIIACHPK